MARPSDDFHYTYETMANLSGWPRNKVHQDVTRKDLQVGLLEEAAVWLAANGNPDIRARMAKKLMPVVLGTKERRPNENRELQMVVDSDVMQSLFEIDAQKRKKRASKISKGRRKSKS